LKKSKSRSLAEFTQEPRSCEKIAALPPDVREGSAFPYIGLNAKAFGLGRTYHFARMAARPLRPLKLDIVAWLSYI
jgi:hypothetical protein